MAFIGEKFDVDVPSYTDVKLEILEEYSGCVYKEPVFRTGEPYVFMNVLDKEEGWKYVYVSSLLDSKEMQIITSLYFAAIKYLNQEHKGGTEWHEIMTSL